MLFEVSVYDKKGKAGKAWIPQQVVNESPEMGKDLLENFPKPATGLTAKDFQVLDDGAQQNINYLDEKDFQAVDLTHQWVLDARRRGTWGTLSQDKIYVDFPAAIYLIGYVPPALEAGECHKISASVEGRIVGLSRKGYCNVTKEDAIDEHTRAGTALGTQMRAFANSTAKSSVGLSVRAFVFWSSGVLSLVRESSPSTGAPVLPSESSALVSGAGALPPPPFTYRIQVHDSKAPATVRVVTQFSLPNPHWSYEDCQKHPAIHILGIVYKATGEEVQEFGDTFFCYTLSSELAKNLKHPKWWRWTVPSRFETQVELRPGDYQVRVVASDGKKNFGRAEIPLRVEPFDGKQLMISDIVSGGILRDASSILRDAARIAPAPLVPTPLVSKNVEFFPGTDFGIPVFTPLSFYFEIYEPLLTAQTPNVFFSLKITNLENGLPMMNTGPMSAANWVLPGNEVIPIGLKIATGRLPIGSYQLEVQASDSAGRQTAWRAAKFTVH